MKLLNIFKKKTKTSTAKVEKLSTKELDKVVGGTDKYFDPPAPIRFPSK